MSTHYRVFLQKALAPDPELGHVDEAGQVYARRPGPDTYVGRVDLDSGRIYEARLGPDKYLGSVDLSNGKVYRQVALGPDEYLGQVLEDGRCYAQRPFAADPHIGEVAPMPGYALAGAAWLLLLWPAWEAAQPKPGAEQ